MDFKDIKTHYKEFNKHIDFAVLLVNKTLPIINSKIIDKATDLTSNKTLPFSFNELIANYTNLANSFAVLLSDSHVINHNRKSLLRELHKPKDMAYIKEKIDIITKTYESFYNALLTIITIMNYLGSKLEQVKASSEKIESLLDISKVLQTIADKLHKKIYIELQNINKHVSKSGGNDLLSEIKTGGYEAESYREIKIGGGEVYIGGYHANDYFKKKLIKLNLLNEDIKSDPSKLANLKPVITGLKQLKPDLYANLNNQIAYFISTVLPKLMDYYHMRSNNQGNKFQNIELSADSIANLLVILQRIKQIFADINNFDYARIYKDVEEAFNLMNNVKSKEELKKIKEVINSNLEIINAKDFKPDTRIKDKLIINTELQNLTELTLKLKPLVSENIQTSDNMLEQIKILNEHFILEKKHIKDYQDIELNADNIAESLRQLCELILKMISPNNTDNCIKKPALLIKTLILITLYKKISKKRFQKENIPAFKINFKNTKFYDSKTGLNLDNINELIFSYCCYR